MVKSMKIHTLFTELLPADSRTTLLPETTNTTKDCEHTVTSNFHGCARSTKWHFKKTCSTQKCTGLINLKN